MHLATSDMQSSSASLVSTFTSYTMFFLCVYMGNLFVDYNVDFAPGPAKRSHCQTNTQIPQPHALQWRISTACWLTNHNRQTENSCMHPPYSLLKATCKRRVQRSHQPLMYVSAIQSAKSYWQARSSKFKQVSNLCIRQVACWSLLASAKFKVQTSLLRFMHPPCSQLVYQQTQIQSNVTFYGGKSDQCWHDMIFFTRYENRNLNIKFLNKVTGYPV
jgi:hypothetical protein